MSPRRRGRRARRRGPAPTGPRARGRAPAGRDRGPPGPRDQSRAGDFPRRPGSARTPAGARRGPRPSSRQGRRGREGHRDGAGEVGGRSRAAPAPRPEARGPRRTRPVARRTARLSRCRWASSPAGAPGPTSTLADAVPAAPEGSVAAKTTGDARDGEGVAHGDALPETSVAEAPPEGQRGALGNQRREASRVTSSPTRTGAGGGNAATGGSSAGARWRGPRAGRPHGQGQPCKRAIPDGRPPPRAHHPAGESHTVARSRSRPLDHVDRASYVICGRGRGRTELRQPLRSA